VSASDNIFAFALGAGGGLLAWYLLKDRRAHQSSPCQLRLTTAGLTVDGDKVDVPSAVTRCKARETAELVFAADGPASVYAELVKALTAAGVRVVLKAQ
jgi:hypothetical protein